MIKLEGERDVRVEVPQVVPRGAFPTEDQAHFQFSDDEEVLQQFHDHVCDATVGTVREWGVREVQAGQVV